MKTCKLFLAAFLVIQCLAAAAADRPVLHALIVGVGTYKYAEAAGFRNLSGPPGDAAAMRDVLAQRFGLQPANTTMLVDQQATRLALLAALRKTLLVDSRSGDIALFYFAGHGSRIFDTSADESSRFDSTILPVDARAPNGVLGDILDDELGLIVAESIGKGVKPVVILDSCHSGTGIRFLAQARYVAPPKLKSYKVKSSERVRGESERAGGDGTLLAAAQDTEEAVEMERDGVVHGEFTRALIAALKSAEPGATYLDILMRVRVGLAVLGVVQSPQGEGDLQQRFLGSGPLFKAPILAQSLDGTRARVQVGAASGVTVGSRYHFFSTVHSIAGGQAVAKGTVVSVSANTADVAIEQPSARPATSFAVESSHAYGDLKLRIALTGGLPVQRDQVGAVMAKLPYVDVVDTSSATHWLSLNGSRVQLMRADGSRIGPARELGSDVDRQLTVILGRLAHFQSLMRLTNPHNPNSAFKGTVLLADETSGQLRNPTVLDGEAHVKAGQTFKVSIFNKGSVPKYVYLVNLATDLCVTLLSPPSSAADQPLAGLLHTKLLRSSRVPGREYFMLLASDERVALESLQQECIDEDGLRGSVRKTFSDPLAQLLYDAGSTNRGPAVSLPLGSWSTIFFSMMID